MAMRRAAYAAGTPRGSAKLRRLIEISDEAGESGRKVVIFSHFREVLDIVCAALGERALGPLNGSIPSPRRQELVDRFAKAHGHGVLVGQIQAGGVGINMQAALQHPFVHAVGHRQPVHLHLLPLLLEGKTALFDAYARRSDTADAAPGARDVSEAELSRDPLRATGQADPGDAGDRPRASARPCSLLRR